MFYHATLCVSAVFAVAQCLSVCPSVSLVDCTHITKRLCWSGSPNILVFLTPGSDIQFQGEPLEWGHKIQGGGKILRLLTEIAVYLGNGTR